MWCAGLGVSSRAGGRPRGRVSSRLLQGCFDALDTTSIPGSGVRLVTDWPCRKPWGEGSGSGSGWCRTLRKGCVCCGGSDLRASGCSVVGGMICTLVHCRLWRGLGYARGWVGSGCKGAQPAAWSGLPARHPLLPSPTPTTQRNFLPGPPQKPGPRSASEPLPLQQHADLGGRTWPPPPHAKIWR